MKKIFFILIVTSLVSFTGCRQNNLDKKINNTDVVIYQNDRSTCIRINDSIIAIMPYLNGDGEVKLYNIKQNRELVPMKQEKQESDSSDVE